MIHAHGPGEPLIPQSARKGRWGGARAFGIIESFRSGRIRQSGSEVGMSWRRACGRLGKGRVGDY